MITMRRIVQQVAERHRVSVQHVLGQSRERRHSRARAEAMFLIRQTGRFSYPQIGRFFSRDHTSVIHAVRRHEELAGQ